jgi:hypothetical protein
MDCTAAFHSLFTANAAANSDSERKDNTLPSASRYKRERNEAEGKEAAAAVGA